MRLILIALLCIYSSNAFACECVALSPERASEYLSQSKAVFVGKVTRIQEQPATHTERLKYEDRQITFTVEKAWKGVNTKQVTIRGKTGQRQACIGYTFETGKRYLVFTDAETLSVDNSCSPTQLLQDDSKLDVLINSPGTKIMGMLGNPSITFETKE